MQSDLKLSSYLAAVGQEFNSSSDKNEGEPSFSNAVVLTGEAMDGLVQQVQVVPGSMQTAGNADDGRESYADKDELADKPEDVPEGVPEGDPEGEVIFSCGFSEYRDSAGELIGGLDRIGILGSIYWDYSSATGEILNPQVASTVPGGGIVPPPPPAPWSQTTYNARAVLYTKDNGSNNPVDYTISLKGLSVSSADFSDPAANYASYYNIAVVGGKVTLTLTADGLDAVRAANGANIYSYLNIAHGAGRYIVQVILNQSDTFSSGTEDAADVALTGRILDSGGLAHGEWHEGVNFNDGVNSINSSGLGDMVFFSNGVSAVGAGKSNSINTHTETGKTAAVNLSSTGSGFAMHAENAGRNSIDGDTQGGRTDVTLSTAGASTGTGMLAQNGENVIANVDKVSIDSTIGMHAAGTGSNNITARDDLVITASGTALESYAMYANNGGSNSVTTAGKVSLSASSGTNKFAMYAEGSGENYITTVNNSGSSVALTGALVAANNGKNTIQTDEGDDVVYVQGGVNSWSANTGNGTEYGNTIKTGNGNDIVALRGGAAEGNNNFQITGTLVDMGEGDNIFASGYTIAAKAAARSIDYTQPINWGSFGVQVQNCEIISGSGDDIILIEGGLEGIINTGGGDDRIAIMESTLGGRINLGSGNNSLEIGLRASMTTITAGGGDDYLSIGTGVATGNINLGDGQNTVYIGHDKYLNAISKSEVYTGAGNDTITVDGLVGTSTINTGGGDDVLVIDGSTSSTSVINLGSGNNSLTISGVASSTTITAGAENDYLYIGGGVSGGGINLGDGQNRVDIYCGNGTEAISSANLTTGADNDTINLYGGVDRGTVNTGGGDDVVVIDGSTSGAPSTITINLGSGDNSLTISGAASVTTIMAGDGDNYLNIGGDASSTRITAGDGDNYLYIGGDAYSTTITVGGGDNKLYIDGTVNFTPITAGDGDDYLYIGDGVKGVSGITRDINLGNGNNTVHIKCDSSADAFSNANLFTGADNDTINLYGGVGSGTVNTGGGNDVLMINYGSVAIQNSTFDGGGSGSISHGGSLAAVGDILGFSGGAQHHANNLFVSGQHNTVQNFDSLLLDYSSNSYDSISMDDVLETAGKLFGGSLTDTKSVIIQGDDGDEVLFGLSPHYTQKDTGVSIEGLTGTYDHYTDDSSGLHVYIQVLLTTG